MVERRYITASFSAAGVCQEQDLVRCKVMISLALTSVACYSHVAVPLPRPSSSTPMFNLPTTLTTIPLELIDHTLSFLSWPNDLHSLLFVNKFLNPIAERTLYRNIGDLPAQRAVRLLLSLANAPAARCALVKTLSLDFSDNRVLFALELLIAKVLRLLPRLRSLNVEVSIHENRHRALAWIFPRDAPFRLLSFSTSIRFLSFILLPLSMLTSNDRLDQDLATFLESQPEIRDLSLRGIPAYSSDPFTIPRSALPHLESFRSVHVDPDTLGEVRTPLFH